MAKAKVLSISYFNINDTKTTAKVDMAGKKKRLEKTEATTVGRDLGL